MASCGRAIGGCFKACALAVLLAAVGAVQGMPVRAGALTVVQLVPTP